MYAAAMNRVVVYLKNVLLRSHYDKKNMTAVAEYVTTVEPTTDGHFLWHVAPGFVQHSQPVVVCVTTHPQFAESMRLFGVPVDHPSRLENVGSAFRSGGFQGSQWRVLLCGRSYTGVFRYYLVNAMEPTLCLQARGASVQLGSGTSPDHAWYLVPHPPYGWDIVHAGSGLRLDMNDTDDGLQLTNALNSDTHFDILRPGRTKGFHRSHFWLPTFLQQAFCNQPRTYPVMQPLEAVTGNLAIPGPGAQTSGEDLHGNESEHIRTTGAESVYTLVGVNNNGTTTRYKGWIMDPSRLAADPLLTTGTQCGYQSNQILLERQLFGDTRHRTADDTDAPSTREYNLRWKLLGRPMMGITYYQRRSERRRPEEIYRQCLLRLGMDATECKEVLETLAPTPDLQRSLKRTVFEQVTGQEQLGLCGPVPSNDQGNLLLAAARLWSHNISEFCRSSEARENAYCRNGLLSTGGFEDGNPLGQLLQITGWFHGHAGSTVLLLPFDDAPPSRRDGGGCD